MNELRATRGPWELMEVPRGFIVTADERSYDIAMVRNLGNHDNKANAALIAAAPELYAALEALFACDMEHVLMFDGKEDQVAAIQLARAALKKARGEA